MIPGPSSSQGRLQVHLELNELKVDMLSAEKTLDAGRRGYGSPWCFYGRLPRDGYISTLWGAIGKNHLYLQAELVELEKSLREQQEEDRRSKFGADSTTLLIGIS
jgi:hypothetical protein